EGAGNFARAARAVGVRRIVYLGGLGGEVALSTHLASRQEVGRLLRDSGVPTIELRASVIIGSGSLSFELVRALVERLPVLVTPVYARVGQKLIESLRNETVVTSPRSAELFPEIEPCDMKEAIAQALANEDREIAETRWSDARSSLGTVQPWGGATRGFRLV